MLQARSLFVKNLNFKTTDESLRNHFSELMKEGRILSVKVMGYEFKCHFIPCGVSSFSYFSFAIVTIGEEAFEKREKCFYGVWIY